MHIVGFDAQNPRNFRPALPGILLKTMTVIFLFYSQPPSYHTRRGFAPQARWLSTFSTDYPIENRVSLRRGSQITHPLS
jgi:hypothetical protein